jgi:ABC-type proline/glycine betaine transport system permease subunit
MHEVALADVDASRVERAVAFAVTFVVVDAGVGCAVVVAIGGVSVGGVCGADVACVIVGVAVVNGVGVVDVRAGILVGALVVVVYWLVFDTVVRVLVDVAVNWCLL